MKVVFWHFIVNNDSRPDEPGIAVHLLNNGLQGCYIGFLSQGISYHNCHLKIYEEMHVVVVNMFSQDKFENPVWLIEEWFMLITNHGCAKAINISGDYESKNKRTRLSSIEVETCIPAIEKKIKQETSSESDNDD